MWSFLCSKYYHRGFFLSGNLHSRVSFIGDSEYHHHRGFFLSGNLHSRVFTVRRRTIIVEFPLLKVSSSWIFPQWKPTFTSFIDRKKRLPGWNFRRRLDQIVGIHNTHTDLIFLPQRREILLLKKRFSHTPTPSL